MNREVEIKVSIEGNIDDVIHNLSQNGIVLGEPVIQEDSVFCNYEGDYRKYPNGALFFRIRKQGDFHLFTMKSPQKNSSDCIEHETKVEKPEEIVSMLKMLGYHFVNTVKKERRKAKTGDYEICLDNVSGLGVFVEVEKMTDGNDSEKVQEELFKFISAFGLKIKKQIFEGYDILMWKKENNIG